LSVEQANVKLYFCFFLSSSLDRIELKSGNKPVVSLLLSWISNSKWVPIVSSISPSKNWFPICKYGFPSCNP
jgi:hypothetical protein